MVHEELLGDNGKLLGDNGKLWGDNGKLWGDSREDMSYGAWRTVG